MQSVVRPVLALPPGGLRAPAPEIWTRAPWDVVTSCCLSSASAPLGYAAYLTSPRDALPDQGGVAKQPLQLRGGEPWRYFQLVWRCQTTVTRSASTLVGDPAAVRRALLVGRGWISAAARTPRPEADHHRDAGRVVGRDRGVGAARSRCSASLWLRAADRDCCSRTNRSRLASTWSFVEPVSSTCVRRRGTSGRRITPSRAENPVTALEAQPLLPTYRVSRGPRVVAQGGSATGACSVSFSPLDTVTPDRKGRGAARPDDDLVDPDDAIRRSVMASCAGCGRPAASGGCSPAGTRRTVARSVDPREADDGEHRSAVVSTGRRPALTTRFTTRSVTAAGHRAGGEDVVTCRAVPVDSSFARSGLYAPGSPVMRMKSLLSRLNRDVAHMPLASALRRRRRRRPVIGVRCHEWTMLAGRPTRRSGG